MFPYFNLSLRLLPEENFTSSTDALVGKGLNWGDVAPLGMRGGGGGGGGGGGRGGGQGGWGGGGSDSGSFGVAMKLCGGEFDGSILRSV